MPNLQLPEHACLLLRPPVSVTTDITDAVIDDAENQALALRIRMDTIRHRLADATDYYEAVESELVPSGQDMSELTELFHGYRAELLEDFLLLARKRSEINQEIRKYRFLNRP